MAMVEERMLDNHSSRTEDSIVLFNNISCKISSLLQKLPLLGELFEFHGKVGEGTFSCVYLVTEKSYTQDNSKRKFAIKHLIPTCHPKRIYRELWCMQEMGGVDNIAEIYMCLRNEDCITFIMPYLEHETFISYVMDMTVKETKLYMKHLLLAVRRVHSFGIIHRDIKPSNFLYNRKKGKFLLVDFGLSQKVDECSESKGDENIDGAGKKRKRDDGENYEMSTESQPLKRQALQQLSNNFTSLSDSIPKDISETIKRQPLLGFNKQINFSFLRVQNSQVKCLTTGEKLFAKPLLPVKKCQCDGKPRICNLCLTRKAQNAPRAGTPGFRPPEVLLKCPHQTTAVDMWAVGVILLSILSGTHPFFRSPDDVTGLAEMITIFGSEKIKNEAKKLGRNVVCSEDRRALDLKKVCEMSRRAKREAKQDKGELKKTGSATEEGCLKYRKCPDCCFHVVGEDGCLCSSTQPLPRLSPQDTFPSEAFDLLYRLLDVDPTTRITAEEALNHPFIVDVSSE